MDPLWLIRMVRWAHRAPAGRLVVVVAIAGGLAFAIAGVEHLWGWPDWLRVNGRLRR